MGGERFQEPDTDSFSGNFVYDQVIPIFPKKSSCLRHTIALAVKQSKEWLTWHRYLRINVPYEQPKGPVDQLTSEELAA